jgi:hypothetical protein
MRINKFNYLITSSHPSWTSDRLLGTYTVNDEAKTLTFTIERCTFPQWDGGGGHTVSIAFPTEDEFHFTVTKPFPDPTLGLSHHTFISNVLQHGPLHLRLPSASVL